MEFVISSSSILLLLLHLAFFNFHCSSLSSIAHFPLSPEKPENVIVSQNQAFSAGFYAVGGNAYCFAVWFTQPPGPNSAVVWMANRDQPVNGNRSTLSLLDTGNLILTDAGQFNVWATNTTSSTYVKLILKDDGNLVLHDKDRVLWQTFDFPTDTLLPGQVLTRNTKLVSSRSKSNHSSGFYKLFFDNDNLLRLLYDGPDVSSVYWPDPWLVSWEAGRSTYNASRVAVLDFLGNFSSSDDFTFRTSDYGTVLQRRLKLDCDGNARVYSRKHGAEEWYVSWQAKPSPCTIHGICGPNSTCSHDPTTGRKCSCLPGYRMKNNTDWSYGCKPKFRLSCSRTESRFQLLSHVEFYGYDYGFFPNYTYKQCKHLCLRLCNCKGFQFKYYFDGKGNRFNCYPKTSLLNGHYSPDFKGVMYLRLPKRNPFFGEESVLKCSKNNSAMLKRVYIKRHERSLVKVFLWMACAIGALEIASIFVVWSYLMITKQKSSANEPGYILAASGFRKFSYCELKAATKWFSQEIGRGAAGVVYKGQLSDGRIAAIKRLNEADQGEGEFPAEVSIIGRLNHMNLIDMWGYCAEGKHRLLVYEYMENGSLAENLSSKTLDWSRRYNIALGTARGLAYLHEECLEWILHCDIKPQNILLDSNYEPKVADFGLSKLLNRNNINNSGFSRIRGTRGYMAPEWVFNLPITSKVDVYSYGIVILEMITGKSSTMGVQNVDGAEGRHGRLVTWVREKRRERHEVGSWVEEITDPAIEPNYDVRKMEVLARVALDCVEEEKDARPTMNQVVEMLQSHENDSSLEMVA